MNWFTFQTNNLSHEKAFESLCNQLFENWCKETYNDDIMYFTVTNGDGGDGGVESYVNLKNQSIVGLQAKWFPNVIESKHISQIRNSIKTALAIRPSIKTYIVCVPRNLAPKTGKTKNDGDYEEKRWLDLVDEIKQLYPELELVLWNDHFLSKELQKDSSVGILKYWFHNSEISYDKLTFAFKKSKQSWLFTKYVPELNAYGKIYNTLISYLGEVSNKEKLIKVFTKINILAMKIEKPAKDLIQIVKENTEKAVDLKKHIQGIIVIAHNLVIATEVILESLKNDTFEDKGIDFDAFNHDFISIADNLSKNSLLSHHFFHTWSVTKIINELSKFDYYELLDEYQKNVCRHNLIFKGDPGTGKTHGVASVAEKILLDRYHAAIVIQARDIETSRTWKEIVISNLGLANDWDEEELWQALVAMVNTNKVNDRSLTSEIKITPRVLIVVDGVDESSTTDRWEERLKEATVISQKYPQIKFCITSRPFLFNREIDDVKTVFLSPSGDISAAELFDSYIKHYNIRVTNSIILKSSLNTPLSLKLFCELYQNKTIKFDETYDVSLPALLSKKIHLIDMEFSKFVQTDIKNQYILKAIKELTEWFFTHNNIEHEKLVTKLMSNLSIDKNLSSLIVEYLQKYGILNCYCKHSDNPFESKKYIYTTGIHSYFDHASTIIVMQKYTHPAAINFKELQNISTNALYVLAVVSIIKYGYLITQNITLRQIVDDSILAEIQYWAFIHAPINVAKSFEGTILERMKDSSDLLYIMTNRIILPLARKIGHPLGVNLLDKFLSSFDKPAYRDIVWAPIGYLKNAYEKKWGRNVTLDLEEYPLQEIDTHEGLPTIYAWALSSLNNSLRSNYRRELMKWAVCQPMEFFKLFKKFSNVNDLQILGDLYSILMCVVYETNNVALISESYNWIYNNVLSAEKIDGNRSIAVRYYAIAIVQKAKELNICDENDGNKLLPPYSVSNNAINLSKEALSGTRMGGYKGITYDLSRYVLIDHIEGSFVGFNHGNKKELDELLADVSINLAGVNNVDFEPFILSAAFAFITDMGWNEDDFCNYNQDSKTGKIIGGIDCSISGTYYPADHGAQSNVMTVCEKYIWLARDQICGFLCDRLNYAETHDRLTDYGMIQDFVIPIQEINQVNPDAIPEDNPWHIPEADKVFINTECNSAEDVIKQVGETSDIDWANWLFIKNNNMYNVQSKDILALYNYSSFKSANIETTLSVNTIIIEKHRISQFIKYLQTKDNYTKISVADDLTGEIEANCYITPKECCWFTWKAHYEPYKLENFDGFNLLCAVDKGCWSHNEYGDVYYYMPSRRMRKMLGIVDSNGYIFYDKDRHINAEYTVTGKPHHTCQEYVWADKKAVLSRLDTEEKTLVWLMREYRQENGISREKFGNFFVDKSTLYIGYLEGNTFVTHIVHKEIKSSKR